ncbi:LacI family DNA-binding transcriptional regulator [Pelomonas sp. KK5]|uniref:LacI family DNA-binding transcriptional regulator n=1 Tax=Pelomonas sp. KK5 TaxID=1855730 RepID=UPI00097C89A1|nr:LacI family DNA-binding transcriptional regulator [Pelomonas sp. KK5]
MPATIRDVAKAAGVSVATVSRALNGTEKVLPETRERIEAAAKALRFVPSGAARSLSTRSTQTIGAMLPDLHGEYFSELIRGIDLAARARGLHLLLSSSHGDADEAAAAMRAMNGRVDGLLLMSPHVDEDFLRGNLPADLPVVLMNTTLAGRAHPTFRVDNYGGARRMVEHLQASGRRRIALIAGPASNPEALARQQGYTDAVQAAGAAPLVQPGDFTEAAGWRAGQELLAMTPRPDAVFACNDMMAIGLIAALREGGISVPQDMAVAGFDDIPIARYLSPTLTTIRVPVVGLGTLAVEALVQQIGEPQAEPVLDQLLNVELIVRDSSAPQPPPSRGAPPRH